MRLRLPSVALATILAVSLAACGGSDSGSAPVQPQYQPQITNVADSFGFQLTGVANGDGTLSYTWHNTGTMASVDRSSAVSAGSVTLTLRDAAGAQVYQGALDGATGSVSTVAGAAGDWTIVVDFTHTTGTINFRAQTQ
ncbi:MULTISPECIES: hypothetical protein [unclassified Anaeromyxobacter]|uniref:hypothetical protein n=1 Tax=unclassified Anaeromyxobacter TaxID=2620896 RepID=UPI001F5A5760|nr:MULTISPECIES: hypothetical protein [unclassified Anaeromyxobacter]